MRVSWTFHECNEAAKRESREYWSQKQRRLERLLSRYPRALCRLDITLFCHATRQTWESRAVLQLPTGTLVASKERPTLRESIDLTLDALVSEIRRHKELVRKDHVIRRRLERRRNLSAAGSCLAQDVAARRKEAFFQLLEPMMASLLEDARQQLRISVLEGKVGENEVAADDIVNDAIIRAWEQFEERPPEIDLELWFSSLIQEGIRDACAQFGGGTLSREAPAVDEYLTPEEDIDEPAFWLERTLATPLPATLEELLLDDDSSDPAGTDGEADEPLQLRRALAMLPPEQRDVFWLREVVGYDMDEIALMQDKTEQECTRILEAARAALREQLKGETPKRGTSADTGAS